MTLCKTCMVSRMFNSNTTNMSICDVFTNTELFEIIKNLVA